ncbi:hypothetical protein Cni_G22138 [Canna indica]|uniref:J domain-containing protein n=1 Tax=Canna indica TaxID=4628 RepID=A0AAQ3KQW2_9LILI|nr:hypothetical protein Cni_G22138 [Canna indica]
MASLALSHGSVPPPVSPLNHPNGKNRRELNSLHCRNISNRSRACRAASPSSSSTSWTTDFDLYELLGVDSSSDQLEIKKAYRALQKRCHPDIAGPAGHDMAILLNEIYSVLSDPIARNSYDLEQTKLSQFQGYTGKPLYSAWYGSENEERAVFVDEIKCVGCLKCALFANKTFAIESVYGRARVVAQWADPEDKILDAIQTCPVDCISIVERSNLAALEFLMSKQPRGSVRISAGNTVGTRVSNIFAEVTKFQNRYQEIRERASRKDSKGTDLRRESRFSAIQDIRSISNWWYWKPPSAASVEADTSLILTSTARSRMHNIERLQEAAARHKAKAIARRQEASASSEHSNDEYWNPITFLPPPPSPPSTSSHKQTSSTKPPTSSSVLEEKDKGRNADDTMNKRKRRTMDLIAPLLMAMISSASVGFRGREMVQVQGGGLEEHIAGSAVLGVVNSFELQIVLAGVTWFVIGMGVVSLVEAIESKAGSRR